MVFLSSMTRTLMEKTSIFVANQEPYSSGTLSPKNLFLMHELVDFPPCLVNAFHINSIIGINQLLQLLLFGIQTVSRVPEGNGIPSFQPLYSNMVFCSLRQITLCSPSNQELLSWHFWYVLMIYSLLAMILNL